MSGVSMPSMPKVTGRPRERKNPRRAVMPSRAADLSSWLLTPNTRRANWAGLAGAWFAMNVSQAGKTTASPAP